MGPIKNARTIAKVSMKTVSKDIQDIAQIISGLVINEKMLLVEETKRLD